MPNEASVAKKRKKEQAAPAAFDPRAINLNPGDRLVLRTCDAKMQGHGRFQWPMRGVVTAPDWEPTEECGAGLHGLLWGTGSVSYFSGAEDAKWLVVEVAASTPLLDLGDKVKFQTGEVLFVGKRDECVAIIQAHAPAGTAVCYGTATAGVRGTATAGYAGTATAGYAGTATAGDAGTATAGVRGTATAGYAGTATAGDAGTATAGDAGTATAGVRGTATAGYAGTATAGYAGTATAGVGGTATAGYAGTATAGDAGTATAGYAGTATAGEDGAIAFLWWDDKREKYRRSVFNIGDEGVEPNVAYKCEDGKLVRANA